MPNGSGDPSPFQCFCGATFDTAPELHAHSLVEHPDPSDDDDE